jgi:hypothetical protein
MGQITIAITKRVAFRDWTQDFANVYTYTSSAANPDEAGAMALIDELVAFEKTIHSVQVGFALGRCWSSGGSTAENSMIAEKTLSGNGALSDFASMDRERALLIQWPAGFDSRGHPVRLKKWYHTCAAPSGVSITTAMLANQTGLSTSSRNAFAALVNPAVTQIGPSNQWLLSADSGRVFEAAPETHRYLEHHQMGDQWR